MAKTAAEAPINCDDCPENCDQDPECDCQPSGCDGNTWDEEGICEICGIEPDFCGCCYPDYCGSNQENGDCMGCTIPTACNYVGDDLLDQTYLPHNVDDDD